MQPHKNALLNVRNKHKTEGSKQSKQTYLAKELNFNTIMFKFLPLSWFYKNLR